MAPDLSRFQDEHGNWLEADKWPTVRAEVTCRTAGCPAENVTEMLDLIENIDGVLRAQCGRCGETPEICEVPHG